MNLEALRIWAIISIILIILFDTVRAQNCDNSGFELGTSDGYRTYVGGVSSDTVIVDFELYDSGRHKVMRIQDGIDPIAEMFCDSNSMIPVVPKGGGRYSMRLGNSGSGAEAERAVFEFTVTEEVSFFLLQYAVILEDPSHGYDEQPRFEMNIKNDQNETYPCGHYEVRAGPDVPFFENCGGWRVRPWTAIGVELLSYLGETIQIELLTTDCSRGGHAGYAYFDATCQPLEIQLLNYCSDSSLAIMQVTDGFDEYLWNTGDTTSTIYIHSPQEGDVYSVFVTSATGCQIELRDTIPHIDPLDETRFDPPIIENFCRDTQFWFRPSGLNIDRLYSINDQLFVDSVLIQNDVREDYTFVAYSDFGCGLDTVTHRFNYNYYDYNEIEVKDISCTGNNDGVITTRFKDSSQIVSYSWQHGPDSSMVTGLSEDTYYLNIKDSAGCVYDFVLGINEPFKLDGAESWDRGPQCLGDSRGVAGFNARGGIWPYQFSVDTGRTFTSSSSYGFFKPGDHLVVVKDNNNCLDTFVVDIDTFPIPIIDQIISVTNPCLSDGGEVSITPYAMSVAPFQYSINNGRFQSDSIFSSLSGGEYSIAMRDDNGCVTTDTINLDTIVELQLILDSLKNTLCAEYNGYLNVNTNYINNNLYRLDGNPWKANSSFDNLAPGNYRVFVRNDLMCMDSIDVIVDTSYLPELSYMVDHVSCYGDSTGEIRLLPQQNVENWRFRWGRGDTLPSLSMLSKGVYSLDFYDTDDCRNSYTFNINEPDSLQLSYTFSPSCPDESTGEINLVGSGGVRPYSYSIDNGGIFSSDSIFSSISKGEYKVLLFDDLGCIDSVTVLLTEFVKPIVDSISLAKDTCLADVGEIAINLRNSHQGPFSFSLNLDQTQLSNRFTGLSQGLYRINVSDTFGCTLIDTIEILGIEPSYISEIEVTDSRCEKDNGEILVSLNPQRSAIYKLNSDIKEYGALIQDLGRGEYVLMSKDIYGCQDVDTFYIDGSLNPIINDLEVISTPCLDVKSSLYVDANGGTGVLTYMVNDTFIQNNALFNNLIAGLKIVNVKDELECFDQDTVFIDQYYPMQVAEVTKIDPECGESNGSLRVVSTGGVGQHIIFYNGQEYLQGEFISDIGRGSHVFDIYDSSGCELRIEEFFETECAIFIPNIFSPNGDAMNDVFSIYGSSGIDLEAVTIFNRWGDIVFNSNSMVINDTYSGWDGSFNGNSLSEGVYIYSLVYRDDKGVERRLSGDITLVR